MEKVDAWKGSDGKLYASEAEARQADERVGLEARINTFLNLHRGPYCNGCDEQIPSRTLGEWLVENAKDLRWVLWAPSSTPEPEGESRGETKPLPLLGALPEAATTPAKRNIEMVLAGCISILRRHMAVVELQDSAENETPRHNADDVEGLIRELEEIQQAAGFTAPELMHLRWEEATGAFSAAVEQGILPVPDASAPQWARDLSDLFEGRVAPKVEAETEVLL